MKFDKEKLIAIKEQIIETSKATGKTTAKTAKKIEKTKETIDEKIASIKNAKHNIIEVKNSNIKILLPNNYVKSKKKPSNKDELLYEKKTAGSQNILMINPANWEDSMLSIDEETIIDLTRNNLSNNQGLIEVGKGVTNRGECYGYSIIKEIGDDLPNGAYLLRINIGNEKDTINVHGYFMQLGMSGLRESIVAELATRAGLINPTETGMEGWTADPYDPNYKKGQLKNLSETNTFDAMFADHPLSQARELLLALTEDKLIIHKDLKDNDTASVDDAESKDKKTSADESEFLTALFTTAKPKFNTEIIEIEEKKQSLDEQLNELIGEYNVTYSIINDSGTGLYYLKERSIDVLNNVEGLINSIANHPKSFDTDINEIKVEKRNFTSAKEYAANELSNARNSIIGAGAGTSAGLAVASIAPTAAMWVATTFGTASTGTAIATLSGAAMQNAALAWLGGGAIAAGGGGVAAGGHVLLLLAGPLGISIAGVSLLASIALFTKKKIESNKSKLEEIEAVKKNIQILNNLSSKIKQNKDKMSLLRDDVASFFIECLPYYGKNYDSLDEKGQADMTALVNKAKALSSMVGEEIK